MSESPTSCLCILKNFLFCDVPSAVAAITFKLFFSKYLTACQNIGIIRYAVIPSVAYIAKLYDSGLTTLLTKNAKTCVASVCVFFRVAKLTLVSPESTNPIN